MDIVMGKRLKLYEKIKALHTKNQVVDQEAQSSNKENSNGKRYDLLLVINNISILERMNVFSLILFDVYFVESTVLWKTKITQKDRKSKITQNDSESKTKGYVSIKVCVLGY